MNKRWDRRLLALAQHIAGWSKDPSTQVGAVLAVGNKVIGLGYNGIPAGVKDLPARLNNRDLKLAMTVHAEVNAILMARDNVRGSTLYTWPLPPCSHCAALAIQSGVRRVVSPSPRPDAASRWGSSLRLAHVMFAEAGVKVVLRNE